MGVHRFLKVFKYYLGGAVIVFLLSQEVYADEILHEWNQSDFYHGVGRGDYDTWLNVNESGEPVEGDVINGFNWFTHPDGVLLVPGYYRLIIETQIRHSVGEDYPVNEILELISIYGESGNIKWIKPKPADGYPFSRMYFRGSFPSDTCNYYQTGTFFMEDVQKFWFSVYVTGAEVIQFKRVWLLRNVDPDPGSIRVSSWNVYYKNDQMEEIGDAVFEYLNAPDLAAFQELSYTKRHRCNPGLYGKENCILGIMTGYAQGFENGWRRMNLGNYGFSDGDLFDVYGIGNWKYYAWKGYRTDHYQGIITKKSVWKELYDDPIDTYNYLNKGVGKDGEINHDFGFGTYNCTDRANGCWRCPWYAKNEYDDCCGIPGYLHGNAERCRSNYYFTNDSSSKKKEGRHVTARFKDRSGKEGVIVTTHLYHKGASERRNQMVDIIEHVTDDDAMYGMEYEKFKNNPLIFVGDFNLGYEEQFRILDNMREELESRTGSSCIIDLTLSHGLHLVDTRPGHSRPGHPCDDVGDLDPLDKIYLVGGAAAMDNDVDFYIGTNIGLYDTCCSPPCVTILSTETDHYPVYATLSTRTIENVLKDVEDVEEALVRYSGEDGEHPDFDMKFEWTRIDDDEWLLSAESRHGVEPWEYPNVSIYSPGIEKMAAYFDGRGYVMFPHNDYYSAKRRISIEAWIKPTEIERFTPYTIVAKGDFATQVPEETKMNYLLEIGGDPISPGLGWLMFHVWHDCKYIFTADGNFNEPVIHTNKWHHVLASFDGLHARIVVTRVNGPGDYERLRVVEEYMGTNITMCVENNPLLIGARYQDGVPKRNFVGIMDDLQIYSEVAR